MEEIPQAQANAKMMYYANQIIYRTEENEKEMRFTSDFLEYLRYSVAESITYEQPCGNHDG
jgi:hypothetical protein